MSPSFPIDRSLPRAVGRRARIAFVLGGGAALGAYQAGVLLALAEWGIVPDMLVGASAGALNAAFIATHPGVEGATALASLWRTTHRRDVQPNRLVH
jgi:NTE family protein